MGCWNETCAVTLTSIKSDDDAVMVLFRHNNMQQYGVGSYQYFKRKFLEGGESIFNNLVGVFKGKYDDYGSISDITSGNDADFPKDFDSPKNDKYIWFWVHESVWNEVVQFVENQTDTEMSYVYSRVIENYEFQVKFSPSWGKLDQLDAPCYLPGQEKLTHELLRVLRFMFYSRRDPWAGEMFRGCQSDGLDENRLIIELIRKQLDRLQAFYDEIDGEEAER